MLFTFDRAVQADANNITNATAALSFGKFTGFVIADMVTAPLFKLIRIASQSMVIPVLSSQITGRLIAQCARQAGIAGVYWSFLDFEQNFYFSEPGLIVGNTFLEEIYHMVDGGIVCGVFHEPRDDKSFATARNLTINPPDDYLINDHDKIIVLATNATSYSFKKISREQVTPPNAKGLLESEKTLKIIFSLAGDTRWKKF